MPLSAVAGKTNNISLGFSLMLLAFLFFASMESSAKWLVMGTLPALQVVFMRYLGHFAATLLVYIPREGRQMFISNQPKTQLLRALFLLISTTLNFFALKYLPLTVTIAIFFAVPLIVCLMSIPVLGEKVGIHRLAAVLAGFGGVLVIVQPWNVSFSKPMLFAITATFSASAYFVLTRKIAGADRNSVSQVYSAGLATAVLAPAGILYWQSPANTIDWILLCAIGTLGFVGHSLLTAAHRFAEASVLAPSVYSQILYATFFSWFVFHEAPAPNTMLGTLIIVASGIYVWHRERRQQGGRLSQNRIPALPDD